MNETMGGKPDEKTLPRKDLEAWPWVNPTYTLKIDRPAAEIASIEIDPSQRLADVDRKNNTADLSNGLHAYTNPTR